MKSLSLLVLFSLVLSSVVFASPNQSPGKEEALALFFKEMGNLETSEGESVAALFAADVVDHFSGSTGNRVKLQACGNFKLIEGGEYANCDLTVVIYYGHHGEENGVTETATYKLSIQRDGTDLFLANVKRTLTRN